MLRPGSHVVVTMTSWKEELLTKLPGRASDGKVVIIISSTTTTIIILLLLYLIIIIIHSCRPSHLNKAALKTKKLQVE